MIIVIKEIDVDSDEFLDMPESSQLLYFHFFARRDLKTNRINNVNALMRACGGNSDDLEELFKHHYIDKPLDSKEFIGGLADGRAQNVH